MEQTASAFGIFFNNGSSRSCTQPCMEITTLSLIKDACSGFLAESAKIDSVGPPLMLNSEDAAILGAEQLKTDETSNDESSRCVVSASHPSEGKNPCSCQVSSNEGCAVDRHRDPPQDLAKNPDSETKMGASLQQEKKRARPVLELANAPRWGSVSICGLRLEMEDAMTVVPRFTEMPLHLSMNNLVADDFKQSCTHAHFFGVYDGHGGSQVADHCKKRVHSVLAKELEMIKARFPVNVDGAHAWQARWREAFVNCFVKVDAEVEGKSRDDQYPDNPDESFEPIAPETVGSTAVVAVVSSSHLIVANCGDSRAVLCRGREALALSVDHKPNRDDEYARIESAGGKVIHWNGYRVFGVLAMSRSIGDRYLKPWIIPDPEITFTPRAKEDECLVLASDGLWDVISNEEACEVARRRILLWHKKNATGVSSIAESGEETDPAAQAAAECLSKLALQRGSKDNISVVVVDLKAHRKFRSKA